MESLGIDPKLLLAQIINFGLFFFIFKKFIAKPFSQFLHSEVEKEKEKERIMADLQKKEEQAVEAERKMKEKVKKQYESEVRLAKEEAVKTRERLVADAQAEAEEIVNRGKKQIADDRTKMEKEMRAQVVDLSVAMLDKGLSSYLTEEMQKKVTQNIIKNYGH